MQNITSAPHKDKQPHRLALPSRERQQSIKQQVVETVRAALTQVLEQALRAEVVTLLGRVKSQRRDLADVVAVKATCNRLPARQAGCHRSLRRNFYRDGSYPRSLLTGPAYVRIRVPRLSCTCGGTVDHRFTLFAPYQRVWFDLQARARQLAGLCLSLRDSVEVLACPPGRRAAENGQPLAIGTLNGLINEAAVLAKAFRSGPLGQIPAVVALDGLWVKLLVEGEDEYIDKRERRRPAPEGKAGRLRKRRRKVPILVAYGIDPRTGQKRLS